MTQHEDKWKQVQDSNTIGCYSDTTIATIGPLMCFPNSRLRLISSHVCSVIRLWKARRRLWTEEDIDLLEQELTDWQSSALTLWKTQSVVIHMFSKLSQHNRIGKSIYLSSWFRLSLCIFVSLSLCRPLSLYFDLSRSVSQVLLGVNRRESQLPHICVFPHHCDYELFLPHRSSSGTVKHWDVCVSKWWALHPRFLRLLHLLMFPLSLSLFSSRSLSAGQDRRASGNSYRSEGSACNGS